MSASGSSIKTYMVIEPPFYAGHSRRLLATAMATGHTTGKWVLKTIGILHNED
ncbi:hypothetical protein RGR602_CH02936 [Rhizobium gallicum bv. gallicum R602sp]|uniref:Uncharacterized protein n=1 Tax=Rhizobium gallicum bv. gallicum R602sp TaxID=1041138 RepID=A0A0B4X6Q9_9HYPH|nr:hypothetical protein RGR602_CH02936 [Rhizobium gallicum bv. gallicum R602sp]